MQLLLQAAEAGQRGYMLTGQREYKEPFEQAQAQLEAQLHASARAVRRRSRCQANVREIEDLTRRKASELKTTVDMFEGAQRRRARSRW